MGFPIMRPEPSSLILRYKRLKQDHQVINRSERERLSKLRKSKSMAYSFPFHPVGQTFTQKKDQTLSNITSTAFAIGSKASSMDSQPNLGFNPKLYQDSKWCHDTPGTVSKAWTPGGKGIYLRDLAFLPYSVNLKGKKIRKTPYYGQSRIFIP